MRGDVTQGKAKLGNVARGATIAPYYLPTQILESIFQKTFVLVCLLGMALSEAMIHACACVHLIKSNPNVGVIF